VDVERCSGSCYGADASPMTGIDPFFKNNLSETRISGVCSIFLRVDRSINEMHKLRALFVI
jgi:hypothetical protein